MKAFVRERCVPNFFVALNENEFKLLWPTDAINIYFD